MCCPLNNSPSPKVARIVAVFGWITAIIGIACILFGIGLTAVAVNSGPAGGLVLIVTVPMVFLGFFWGGVGWLEIAGSGQITCCRCEPKCLGTCLGFAAALRVISALVLVSIIGGMINSAAQAGMPFPPFPPSPPPSPPSAPWPPALPIERLGPDLGSGAWSPMPPASPPFPPYPPIAPYTPPDLALPLAWAFIMLLMMTVATIADCFLACAQCGAPPPAEPAAQGGMQMAVGTPVAQPAAAVSQVHAQAVPVHATFEAGKDVV